MSATTIIIKRDGSREPFTPIKLSRWGRWAAEQLGNRVDWPTILIEVTNQLPATITSAALQKRFIERCLAQRSWPAYMMAGRLYVPLMRKEIYGTEEMPSVRTVHERLQQKGFMRELDYSDEEYAEVDTIIDHSRDLGYPHFQLDQLRRKYALKDRRINGDKTEYETPQYIFMRMAMALAESQPRDRRMNDLREWYNRFSEGKLNAPTPNYINLGTHHHGYASCCLYTTKDEIQSILAGEIINYTMTYSSAGIGSHLNTRSAGDPVRGGLFPHMGKYPYLRSSLGNVGANTQAGRGGAKNDYYSAYDPEIELLMRLKNPMTPSDRQLRGMDYTALLNKNVVRRAARDEKIFLFNSFAAPDLYAALFSGDSEHFDRLYAKYEADESFAKTWTSARELCITLIDEALETGRNYWSAIDEINRHTPFKDPIYSSNLCCEIVEPTCGYDKISDLHLDGPVAFTEMTYRSDWDGAVHQHHIFSASEVVVELDDGSRYRKAAQQLQPGDRLVNISSNPHLISPTQIDLRHPGYPDMRASHIGGVVLDVKAQLEPEVAMCSIGGVVVSNIVDDDDYYKTMYYGLLMIDKCIHMSHYELAHIGYTAKQRLNAGMGMMDLAYHMARKGLTYDSPEGLREIHRVAERHMWFAIKASLQLGRELGNAPWIHRTKWAEGWLPIDTYCRKIDRITDAELVYNWEGELRPELIAQGGLRNSCLVAYMPGESSSKGMGVANAIYPIREDVIAKADGSNRIFWAARDHDLYQYQYAWDIPTKSMFNVYGVVQKFTDQAISADEYRKIGPGERIGTLEMLENLTYAFSVGMKTRYYLNSHTAKEVKLLDGTTELVASELINDGANCGSGGCAL